MEKLQSKSFVQLKNKLTPVKFEKDCFYFADNKILKSTHNYYYILDSAEKLYVYDPLINGIKYLSHSGLLNDNWPILAGNISLIKEKFVMLMKNLVILSQETDCFSWKTFSAKIYTQTIVP